MKKNITEQEIYSICDLQQKYISLLVCVYSESNFYIIFNERNYFNNIEKNQFKAIKRTSKALKSLVNQAEKQLSIKIKNLNYNIPATNIKIIPHSYAFHFKKPTLFTNLELQKINQQSLKNNHNQTNNNENILFKIQSYDLLEQKKTYQKPPFNQIISSIRINGFLYQLNWKIIYPYLEVFKQAKLIANEALPLPYAINTSMLFSKQIDESIIILWNLDKIELFAFRNKIFIKTILIKEKLETIIKKISKKLHQDENDIKNYLFQIFNLNNEISINKMSFLMGESTTLMENIQQNLNNNLTNYLERISKEIIFILKEKLNFKEKQTKLFLFGDVVQINGIKNYLCQITKNINWNVHIHTFIGIKDFWDTFLIGNAYAQHLKIKILQKNSNLLLVK